MNIEDQVVTYLRHFPKNSEVDGPEPYADYDYAEAMLRYKKLIGQQKKSIT